MLPPEVEGRVAAIAADIESGASELSLRALESFEALLPATPSADTLRELAAKLEAAQPNMASVRNVAHLCARLVAGSSDAALALREVRRELSGAHEKIARNAVKLISGKPTIVTLSRSLAVVSTLKLLHSRRMLATVFVLESLPGREGRRAASQLSASGISTQLTPDTQAANVVRRCDLVLTGADTVLLDGTLVNKAGTRDLALAASVAGKPFYAACETLKIDSVRTAETFSPIAVRPADALPGDRRGHVLFDLTPPQLVKSFITDRGVFVPQDIARVWAL
jgi:translation initiation factor 2B subunit (eIF-2B alpha/beta/delta family)